MISPSYPLITIIPLWGSYDTENLTLQLLLITFSSILMLAFGTAVLNINWVKPGDHYSTWSPSHIM